MRQRLPIFAGIAQWNPRGIAQALCFQCRCGSHRARFDAGPWRVACKKKSVRIATLRSTTQSLPSPLEGNAQRSGASFLDALMSAAALPPQPARQTVNAAQGFQFAADSDAAAEGRYAAADAAAQDQAQIQPQIQTRIQAQIQDVDHPGARASVNRKPAAPQSSPSQPQARIHTTRATANVTIRSAAQAAEPQMSATVLAAKIAATVVLPAAALAATTASPLTAPTATFSAAPLVTAPASSGSAAVPASAPTSNPAPVAAVAASPATPSLAASLRALTATVPQAITTIAAPVGPSAALIAPVTAATRETVARPAATQAPSAATTATAAVIPSASPASSAAATAGAVVIPFPAPAPSPASAPAIPANAFAPALSEAPASPVTTLANPPVALPSPTPGATDAAPAVPVASDPFLSLPATQIAAVPPKIVAPVSQQLVQGKPVVPARELKDATAPSPAAAIPSRSASPAPTAPATAIRTAGAAPVVAPIATRTASAAHTESDAQPKPDASSSRSADATSKPAADLVSESQETSAQQASDASQFALPSGLNIATLTAANSALPAIGLLPAIADAIPSAGKTAQNSKIPEPSAGSSSNASIAGNTAGNSPAGSTPLSSDASARSAAAQNQPAPRTQSDPSQPAPITPRPADASASLAQPLVAPPSPHEAAAAHTRPGATDLPRSTDPSLQSDPELAAQGAGSPAASGINTAKLIQNMSESEMRVGMHSAEFGDISIRTLVSQQQMTAQISVDHGDLGRAISAHLPAMQEKLGGELGLRAMVEVSHSGMSFSGERGGSAGRDQRTGASQNLAASAMAPAESDYPGLKATAAAAGDGRLLDIRA